MTPLNENGISFANKRHEWQSTRKESMSSNSEWNESRKSCHETQCYSQDSRTRSDSESWVKKMNSDTSRLSTVRKVVYDSIHIYNLYRLWQPWGAKTALWSAYICSKVSHMMTHYCQLFQCRPWLEKRMKDTFHSLMTWHKNRSQDKISTRSWIEVQDKLPQNKNLSTKP